MPIKGSYIALVYFHTVPRNREYESNQQAMSKKGVA